MIPRETTLGDDRLILHPFTVGDVPALLEAVRESLLEIRPWMSWAVNEYSLEHALRFQQSVVSGWEQGESYQFAIVDARDGSLLGGCGLNHINSFYRFANLGYWVRTSRTGQGVASRAARLVARFGFEQLGLARAEIVVAVGNLPSLRAAQKAGATREGILRSRLILGDNSMGDAVMHSLIPQDFYP